MQKSSLAALAVVCGLGFVVPVSASSGDAVVVVEDPGIYAELVAMLEREVSSQLTQHLQEEGGCDRSVSVSVLNMINVH
ncbi:hypothetical protein WG628_09410 [Stenotrophomonas maltophilia]